MRFLVDANVTLTAPRVASCWSFRVNGRSLNTMLMRTTSWSRPQDKLDPETETLEKVPEGEPNKWEDNSVTCRGGYPLTKDKISTERQVWWH